MPPEVTRTVCGDEVDGSTRLPQRRLWSRVSVARTATEVLSV